MNGSDDSFQQAIARLHDAMGKVANGDVSAIVALHSSCDEVTGFYGWGGYEKGSKEVAGRWDWASQRFNGGTVSYQNLAADADKHLGFTVDIETFDARLAGEPKSKRWSNRVTHIFRRENGEWKLLHRHASRLQHRAG